MILALPEFRNDRLQRKLRCGFATDAADPLHKSRRRDCWMLYQPGADIESHGRVTATYGGKPLLLLPLSRWR